MENVSVPGKNSPVRNAILGFQHLLAMFPAIFWFHY